MIKVFWKLLGEVQKIWKYFTHLKEFYFTLLGFLILQLGTYYLANLAAQHGRMGDIVIRILGFSLQCLFFVIMDGKLHWFQIRNIWICFLNGILILLKIKINPILSYALVYALTYQQNKRVERKHSQQIEEAFEDDERLYFALGKSAKDKLNLKDYSMVGLKKNAAQQIIEEEDESEEDSDQS